MYVCMCHVRNACTCAQIADRRRSKHPFVGLGQYYDKLPVLYYIQSPSKKALHPEIWPIFDQLQMYCIYYRIIILIIVYFLKLLYSYYNIQSYNYTEV
jgi:hypothetical protein